MKDSYEWGPPPPQKPDNIPEFGFAKFTETDQSFVPIKEQSRVGYIHYVKRPGWEGYVRCIGEGCEFCNQPGQKREERVFLPGYLLEEARIGIFSVTDLRRPGSLLPQLERVLCSDEKVMITVRRTSMTTFKVRTQSLNPGDDDGEAAIEQFRKKCDAGEINTLTVTPAYTEAEIAGLSVTPALCAR